MVWEGEKSLTGGLADKSPRKSRQPSCEKSSIYLLPARTMSPLNSTSAPSTPLKKLSANLSQEETTQLAEDMKQSHSGYISSWDEVTPSESASALELLNAQLQKENMQPISHDAFRWRMVQAVRYYKRKERGQASTQSKSGIIKYLSPYLHCIAAAGESEASGSGDKTNPPRLPPIDEMLGQQR